jgi:flagellar hook-basal body complex protein FliE
MTIGELNTQIKGISTDKLFSQPQNEETEKGSFTSMLSDAITDVNNSQVQGYDAMEGIATGNVENLQEAVQKIDEAELSLKLALEVKTKALNAYKEVMHMQV